MKLITYPNPMLDKKCKPVHPDMLGKKTFLKRISEMYLLMVDNKGAGIAAPQCNWDAHVFIAGTEAFVNAKILEGRGKVTDEEGCLSFPGQFFEIERYLEIDVLYFTIHGKMLERTLTGWEARVFQHELDHCNGITMPKRKEIGL